MSYAFIEHTNFTKCACGRIRSTNTSISNTIGLIHATNCLRICHWITTEYYQSTKERFSKLIKGENIYIDRIDDQYKKVDKYMCQRR